MPGKHAMKTCEYCKAEFRSDKIAHHLAKKHADELSSDDESRSVESRPTTASIHHDEACGICGDPFSSLAEYEAHIISKHRDMLSPQMVASLKSKAHSVHTIVAMAKSFGSMTGGGGAVGGGDYR